MPFNGSGVYTRLNNWSNDAASNLPISATKFDNECNDYATVFNNTLTRDGQGKPSAGLSWAQSLSLAPAADQTVFAAGRTGGTNNPTWTVAVADATGLTGTISFGSFIFGGPSGGIPLRVQDAFSHAAASPNLALRSTAASGFATLSIGANSATIGTNDFSLFQNGTTADASVMNRANAGLFLGTNGSNRLQITAAGNITTNAPVSGICWTTAAVAGSKALVCTGAAGDYSALFTNVSTANNSFGVLITAGTSSSDFALRVQDYSSAIDLLAVKAYSTTQPFVGIGCNTSSFASANRAVLAVNGATTSYIELQAGGTTAGYISYDGANIVCKAGGVAGWNIYGNSVSTGLIVKGNGAIQISAYGAGTLTTDASGNISASDARLKTNIRPFERGLSTILSLKPVLYGWTKESGLDQSHDNYAGFIAQDFLDAIPEAVGTNQDGYHNISDRPVIAALVNATKELAARVRVLEAE